MKILMTGHTSPIGTMLYEHFKYDIHGCSRSNGYDLTQLQDIEKIVERSLQYDHFLNLAHVGTAQTQLLHLIHRHWTANNKFGKIVSFGTLGTELPLKVLQSLKTPMEYFTQKQSLEALHRRLCIEKPFGPQPQSILIRIMNYGVKMGERSSEPTCDSMDVIRTVEHVLGDPCYVSSIDLRKI